MDIVWNDKDKFKKIMQLTSVPYQDFMFDNDELKKRCWLDLIKQWEIVKKYSKIKYEGHPKDLSIKQGN